MSIVSKTAYDADRLIYFSTTLLYHIFAAFDCKRRELHVQGVNCIAQQPKPSFFVFEHISLAQFADLRRQAAAVSGKDIPLIVTTVSTDGRSVG